jgi:hypothetical protein
MSIQGPRYQPTSAYFEAALNLAHGVIDEIDSSAKSITGVEQYREWYQKKVSSESDKVSKMFRRYQPFFKENSTLQDKANSLQQKLIAISEYLMDRFTNALYRKALAFRTCLAQRSDEEIGAYKPAIDSIISSFYEQIEEYDDELNSEETQETLAKIRNLVSANSQLIDLRLNGFDNKNDGLPPPSCNIFKPFEEEATNKAPQHKLSHEYFLVRAAYRNVRAKEYSVCLNQQTKPEIYKIWFEALLKKESSRIDALESSSQRMKREIPVQIAACKESLQALQEQLQKSLQGNEMHIFEALHVQADT